MAGRAGVGVIGVGAIAKYWLQAVHEHPHADLAAVCDTRPPRDSNAFHVPYYTDHAELLADPAVSLVVIDTPPHTHCELVLACLRAGKKTIVEKPLCTTLEDGRKCIDLARKLRVPLYLAWHSKFGAAASKARELAHECYNEGDVIKAFSVDARLDVRKYHDGASWVFNPAISGGGCLIDSAINAISIVVSIAGCLEAAESELITPEGQPVEAVVRAKLRGGDHTRGKVGNLQGTLNFDWLSDEDERGDYVFVFESGTTILFEICSGRVTRRRANGSEEVFDCSGKTALDTNQIPMAMEYSNLFADAMQQLTSPNRIGENVVDDLEFLPFQICMDLYEMARKPKK